MELNDSKFVYNGDTYENRYGIYLRNRRLISRDEYHNALVGLQSQGAEDTLAYKANQYSRDFSDHNKSLYDFISRLSYDKEYETTKEKRGHLPRISPYDEEARISQISKDTDFSLEEAKEINKILLEYTSTNNYTRFSDEERALLDKYIDQVPVYYPPPLYRGMGFREELGDDTKVKYFLEYKDIEIGDIISMRDYTSFSSNPDIAIEFATEKGPYNVYVCNTKNLSGVSIDHMSSLDYPEDEVIYKKDIKMEIINKEIKDNIIYLQVEEISLEEGGDLEDIHELPDSGSLISEHKLLKSRIKKVMRGG